MSRLVILTLGQGNLDYGFPLITVQLREIGNPYGMKFTASLPAAPDIPKLYRNWQSLYSAFYQRLCLRSSTEADDNLEIAEAYITNISEFEMADLCQQMSNLINLWLNSKEFRKIDQQLRTQLQPSEEICFIIETDDNLLRRIPWHLWNFFEDYPHAEVALSASDYQKQRQLPKYTLSKRVKILAIFGNGEGINIEQDRTFLENLYPQADVKFLVEPDLGELNEQLWCQGWDIFFFAGHSCSREKGQLLINQTDTITLGQLKYALKQAINRGLCLAIFNSCDSLGLAQQLQDLQIPQVIVMREPVPDVVAQEFLRYFLTEFSRGQSLYTAVRSARERLQGLEIEYPCATWLPVICQNPAEPPIWQYQPLASRIRVARRYAIRSFKKGKRADIKYFFRTVLVTSIIVTLFLLGVRHLGMLENFELQAYDHLIQLRPLEKPDSRLLIVTIDEADIVYQNQKSMNLRWSLSDAALAKLLEKLEQYHAVAIGIDIYRDFSVDPNYPDLENRLQQDKNLFAVCKVPAPDDGAPDGIPPPPEVPQERLSFSDFVTDNDNIARRQLINLTPPLKSSCTSPYSFSYILARHYLTTQGFQAEINPQGYLQIGNTVFKSLKSQSGGYQDVDASGYQVLLNYRSLSSVEKIAPQISLRDILENQIKPETVKEIQNRIILIGVTAPSSSDVWKTPYTKTSKGEQQISGVFIQAQMVSHILSAVLNNRPLFWFWSEWIEALWVWGWSLVGGAIAWGCYKPLYLGLSISITSLLIFGICFGIFTQAGWIPMIPPVLALIITVIVLKLLPIQDLNNYKNFRYKLQGRSN
jgi:CHASE2 domain-containing sensor protein